MEGIKHVTTSHSPGFLNKWHNIGSTLPAEPFFRLLGFGLLEQDSAWIELRSLLSIHGLLLGCKFKPEPNSHALATVGSVMTIGLSINGCLPWKIPIWQERTRLTSPDIWVRWVQRVDMIQAEPPFLLLDQKDKRRLCWQGALADALETFRF